MTWREEQRVPKCDRFGTMLVPKPSGFGTKPMQRSFASMPANGALGSDDFLLLASCTQEFVRTQNARGCETLYSSLRRLETIPGRRERALWREMCSSGTQEPSYRSQYGTGRRSRSGDCESEEECTCLMATAVGPLAPKSVGCRAITILASGCSFL